MIGESLMKDCRDGIRALENGDINQLEAQYGTESTGRHFVLMVWRM